MVEAIESWPAALRGVPPVERLTSGDGSFRLTFVRRADGRVQFFHERLTLCETDGQEYWVWYSDTPSGLYADLDTARMDAERVTPWALHSK